MWTSYPSADFRESPPVQPVEMEHLIRHLTEKQLYVNVKPVGSRWSKKHVTDVRMAAVVNHRMRTGVSDPELAWTRAIAVAALCGNRHGIVTEDSVFVASGCDVRVSNGTVQGALTRNTSVMSRYHFRMVAIEDALRVPGSKRQTQIGTEVTDAEKTARSNLSKDIAQASLLSILAMPTDVLNADMEIDIDSARIAPESDAGVAARLGVLPYSKPTRTREEAIQSQHNVLKERLKDLQKGHYTVVIGKLNELSQLLRCKLKEEAISVKKLATKVRSYFVPDTVEVLASNVSVSWVEQTLKPFAQGDSIWHGTLPAIVVGTVQARFAEQELAALELDADHPGLWLLRDMNAYAAMKVMDGSHKLEATPSAEHCFSGWWKGSAMSDKTMGKFCIVDCLAKARAVLNPLALNLSGFDVIDGDTLVFPVKLSEKEIRAEWRESDSDSLREQHEAHSFGPLLLDLLPALPDQDVIDRAKTVYPNKRTSGEEMVAHLLRHSGADWCRYLVGAAGWLCLNAELQKVKNNGGDPKQKLTRDQFIELFSTLEDSMRTLWRCSVQQMHEPDALITQILVASSRSQVGWAVTDTIASDHAISKEVMQAILADEDGVSGLVEDWARAIGYSSGIAKVKFDLFRQVLLNTVDRQVILPTSPDQGGPHVATFKGIASGLPGHGSATALAHLVVLALARKAASAKNEDLSTQAFSHMAQNFCMMQREVNVTEFLQKQAVFGHRLRWLSIPDPAETVGPLPSIGQ